MKVELGALLTPEGQVESYELEHSVKLNNYGMHRCVVTVDEHLVPRDASRWPDNDARKGEWNPKELVHSCKFGQGKD